MDQLTRRYIMWPYDIEFKLDNANLLHLEEEHNETAF